MPSDDVLQRIRSRFPALDRMHEGTRVAYFDGPGGTQVPREVLAAVSDYLTHHNANTHWAFPSSAETDAALLEARRALADLVGGDAAEIVFGANMTSLTFHLSRALGRGLGPGDEIVVTELDHQANVAPWTALAAERGVTIRTVPLDAETGALVAGGVAEATTARTRLVAVGLASNALGTLTDVVAATDRAREVGALVFVDAVHYAPHRLIDVAALQCDFLAVSPYKFYGPHLGVLWGRRRLLEELPVPRLDPAPDTAPERWETGTQNHEGIAGAAAAVDFLASLGPGGARRHALAAAFATLHEAGDALVRRMWQGLGELPGVRLFGPPPDVPRTPTVSFAVRGHHAAAVARHLAGRGVFVSHGDFYASGVVSRLDPGPGGLVRAGCACYTSPGDVDRLVAAVAKLAG
jgi:cysteine desulfurase family protein (TIGR01976 family)